MDNSTPIISQSLRDQYEAQVRGNAPRPQTVRQLVTAHLSFCQSVYPLRPGKRSNTFTNQRDATRELLDLYGDQPFNELQAFHLEVVRLNMINEGGLGRKTINDRMARIHRMYRWAASKGWVTAEYAESLAVPGLRKNRPPIEGAKPAKEVKKKPAARWDWITAVLRDQRMSPVVKDMIRVQLRTGMRPAEICELKGSEIELSESLWLYEPEEHKMAYLEMERSVLIASRAQLILMPYLQDGYLFKTRLGGPYRIDSYRQEIHRACDRQKVPRFGPQQIRKRTISEAAMQGGDIAAQKIAGHTDVRVTRKHYIDVRHSPEAVKFADTFG